ncbi:lipopolysaccharide assembly protein LapA domain-containing protein [Sphingomonas sp. ASV193]|uniref:lipopolysaccharide assembly protein LapA domain-containing protein n=1 Tax=Sphingomonas sp. ASV193 TaxID=3144405 RepID=UPI0032E8D594
MRFLKTLLWLSAAMIVLLFAMRNWQNVTVALWGPVELDIKLPLLLLLVGLVGMLVGWAFSTTRQRRRTRALAVPPPNRPAPIASEEEIF